MAAARRNRPSKELTETTSTRATGNGANSNPPKHDALPLAPRRDQISPQPLHPSAQIVDVKNTQEEESLVGSQGDEFLKSVSQPASAPELEVVHIDASVSTSISRQGVSFEADQPEAAEVQQNEKSDAEALRQMKDIAASLSGGLRDQMLLQIDSLQASVTSRAASRVSPENTEQKLIANPSVSAAVTAPIETAELFTPLKHESPARTTQPSVVPSHSRAPSSVLSSNAASALPLPTTSIGITAVKQRVIKIGAIFGEHIQKDHFHARARLESAASSVASTTDNVRSASAGSSQLTIQEPNNRRQSATTPAEPTPAGESTITHDARLPDSTRQVNIAPTPQDASQFTYDTAATRPVVNSTPQEDSNLIKKHSMREVSLFAALYVSLSRLHEQLL